MGVALLYALPWVVAWVILTRILRVRPRLEDIPPLVDGPLVSVIIPARNESRTIATVLNSLLASAYRNLEVIVVDDRSEDDTAAVVASLGSRVTRLETRDTRLIHGAPLPPGWYGKPWACVQGYRAARGELLLFTDADTKHEPMLLPHAVAALGSGRGELVTVMPHQRCVTFWERAVMPQFWTLLGFRFHPQAVNRAERTRDVIANGQFIFMKREDYEAIGTHEAVRHAVAEDLELAQVVRASGRRVWFGFALSLMETRMYHGLAHMIEGWSKNIYVGGRQSFPDEPLQRALVPFALVAAIGFWLVPPVVLAGALSGPLCGWLAPALLATVLSVLFWMVIAVSMRIPSWYGLLYPLGAAMALVIVLRSTWRGSRRIEWKGRIYGAAG
ncbi:MAG TPA: glycosyltransferase family A protein [Gemmatimonadales bacterium]|nr:glycosyltransferase family A protein [Gemmatimonadales bacterium]